MEKQSRRDGVWEMELKKKKNPERERKRSDWGDKGLGREGEEGGGGWREGGGHVSGD